MDGLSVAASGIAVGSIAVQLMDSIKKLLDFWCSVKDAPNDIRAIARGLKSLSSVLDDIIRETNHPTPSMEAILSECTSTAKEFLDMIEGLEKGFESAKSHIRKWNAFKSAFKSEQLKKSQQLLESMKSTLIIAQQMHYGIRLSHQLAIQQHHQFGTQQLELEKTARQISQLTLENSRTSTTVSTQPRSRQDQIVALRSELSQMGKAVSNPVHRSLFEMGVDTAFEQIYDKIGIESSAEKLRSTEPNPTESTYTDQNSTSEEFHSRQSDWKTHSVTRKYLTLQNMFCTIYMTSKTTLLKSRFAEQQSQYEHETSITIYPSWWLVKLGISYAPRCSLSHSTISGWKHSFNPYRLVPSNALIFEFCEKNNLSGVQTLLSRGEASVKDIDCDGRTPLHYAARSHAVDICKLLISEGADKTIRTCREYFFHTRSPLDEAAHGIIQMVKVVDCFDTLRLLSDTMDFSHTETDGDLFLRLLLDATLGRKSEGFNADRIDKNATVLWMLKFLTPDIKGTLVEAAFAECLFASFCTDCLDIVNLFLGLTDYGVNARTKPGGYSPLLREAVYLWDSDEVNMMLKKKADPHLIGFDGELSPRKETPTSLAMYNSCSFLNWRLALRESSIDLDTFVKKELHQGPLKKAGWTEDSLMSLFQLNIHPQFEPPDYPTCKLCNKRLWINIIVEIPWRRWLDNFKEANHIVKVRQQNSEPSTSPSSMISDAEDIEVATNDESDHGTDAEGYNNIDFETNDEIDYATDEGGYNSNVETEEDSSNIDNETENEGSDLDSKKELTYVCVWCYYDNF